MSGASDCHAGMAAMLSTRQLSDAELSAALGPQASPMVQRSNLTLLRAALRNVPRELLPDALADMLADHYGKARASITLRDAVRIVEGGK
jgi:hypothetical protein